MTEQNLDSRMAAIEARLARTEGVSAVISLLAQIERDLRDLSAATCIARFSCQGEVGYIPKQQVAQGDRFVMPGYQERWYFPRDDGHKERMESLQNLANISEHLEHAHCLVLETAYEMASDNIFEITHYLRRFQRDVRNRLTNADRYRGIIWQWSLNELSFCIRSIYVASCETVDYIEDKYLLSGTDYIPVPDRGW
jgi:hypothetical protein